MILGLVLPRIITFMGIAIILGILLGIVGGAAVGITQAIVNRVPLGITVVNFSRDGAIIVGAIFSAIGLLGGIWSQLGAYSYQLEGERIIAAPILGLLGVLLGIAIAIDAWGPGMPLGDAIGTVISTILFWSVLFGILGGVFGVIAGTMYDKITK